ncbi:MAG: zf-HC2 domain-containing protein [Bryobacterales bacterium]|nr:zf-HC2 domain-containing protein [Bryobacterales bacterium]
MTVNECKAVFARLSEYLDQELPGDLCERIEQHIAGCPPCVEFVDSLKKSVNACREFHVEDGPPPLTDAKRDELRHAYERMRSSLKL